jgi:hypothetical protein
MMDGQCTIFFEDPFWVGVFERGDESGYAAAKWVFGAEPGESELCEFFLHSYNLLNFSQTAQRQVIEQRAVNYKRQQREIHKQMKQVGAGTAAQRAIQTEFEQHKIEHRALSRDQREAEQRQKFALRQEKKKKKQQGH